MGGGFYMSDKLKIAEKGGTELLRQKHLERELVEGYTAMARENFEVAEANLQAGAEALNLFDLTYSNKIDII
jgi:hypothetical protein